ncbi:FUSC family protein [Romboutsia weinsteinii]|uniref:FUSC family protein n=1 Tax=Romboutsia weinsteinii TaxID=2020949 RepID=A0A371J694_9FIRM|nr:FUSC family protein [Romboutsia weinsteinii]RDY28188.1 FUSC family protein [Romboutsia weinsteinii]
MTFYQSMQLGARELKPLIKDSEEKSLKRKYTTALILKSFLCILFCMVVVIFFSSVFGQENSIVGVVTILALLTFRFSNLDFNVKQSAFTILGIFVILILGPYLASISNPIVASLINFVSIFTIVTLSCHNIALSNHSILVLSYLLLYGYEVHDINIYINRIFGLILGGIIVAGIFYYKQRKVEFKNTFSTIIKDIDFKSERTKWQLKLSILICTGVLIGELIHLPRAIWIGFSCMSILQTSQDKLELRFKERPKFIILGSLVFAIVYLILPQAIKSNIGIIGGLLVGFSATYKWQTVFNCFGALSTAIPILGFEGAIIFRIINNLFGAIYTKAFDKVFNKIDDMISNRDVIDEEMA